MEESGREARLQCPRKFCRHDVRLCIARQESHWRAKKETSASYPAIGRFCNRDHSSVIVGARKHEARMAGTSISRVKSAEQEASRQVMGDNSINSGHLKRSSSAWMA